MGKPRTKNFSQAHAFSQAAVAEAAGFVAAEHRGKRLLMNVTMGHRSLALRQSTITLVLSSLTMLSLYISELALPTIGPDSLKWWAVGTTINIGIRAALNVRLFWISRPSTLLQSLALRVCPVLIALLAATQWIWSIDLFVGTHLTLPTFVLFTGLVGTSVAVMGMWPSVPVAVACYLLAAWPPFFFRLYHVEWLPAWVLLIVAFGVGLMLWACVYLQINQVQAILDRSDQVDLLVADLHRANAELKQANKQLDSMRSAAASELEARSLFFSGASHDFKQRLHAMKLLAHSAIRSTAEDSAASSPLHRVADAVEDVEQYITNVLDFARFDVNAVRPERRQLQLQQLFQQLELNFEDVAAASSVELFFRPTNLILTTDPAMLQRILENLISNAVKFSTRRVLVAARRRHDGWAIEVRDTGPGIDKAEQELIFIPFRQAASTAGAPGGVGLGLAVVRRFASCLGYEIAIHSSVGKGAVIEVRIPRGDIHRSEATHGTDRPTPA